MLISFIIYIIYTVITLFLGSLFLHIFFLTFFPRLNRNYIAFSLSILIPLIIFVAIHPSWISIVLIIPALLQLSLFFSVYRYIDEPHDLYTVTIILAILLIFFPKISGAVDPYEAEHMNDRCSCLGLSDRSYNIDSYQKLCYGIPHSCKRVDASVPDNDPSYLFQYLEKVKK